MSRIPRNMICFSTMLSPIILVIIFKCLYHPLGPQLEIDKKLNDFLTLFSFLLQLQSSKLRLILKGLNPEYQGSTLADLHAKAVATELRRIVAHAHDVNSTSVKTTKKKQNKTLTARCLPS